MNKQIKNIFGLLVVIIMIASYTSLSGVKYNYYLCGGDQWTWDQIETVYVPEGATAGGWVKAETWGDNDGEQYAWASIQGPGVDIYVDAGGGEDYQRMSFSNGGPGNYILDAGQQYGYAVESYTGSFPHKVRTTIPARIMVVEEVEDPETGEMVKTEKWEWANLNFSSASYTDTYYAYSEYPASGVTRLYWSYDTE